MAYAVNSLPGCQPIATTSTTQNHVLGRIVDAVDPTYGVGEFIYLLGVASTTVGDTVIYNATTWQTTLITTGSKNKGMPVAVAMSANVASQYGWYQVSGNAVMKKTTVATSPGVAIYISGTAGRFKVVASSGQQIVGAATANLTTVVTTTSTVVVSINRPHVEGQ